MKINTLLFIFIILSTKLLASNYALHEPVANMVFDEIFQYFDTAMQNKIGDELYGEISRSNFENKFKEGSHYPDDNDSENRHSHLASLIFDSTNAVQTDLNRYFNNMFWVFGVACHILEDLSCDLFWQGTLAQEYAYGDVSSFSYLTWRYNYDVIKPFNNVENFIDNHGWQAYLIRILSEKEESPKILDNTILSYSNASEKGLFEAE